jgi:hypothetical protein
VNVLDATRVYEGGKRKNFKARFIQVVYDEAIRVLYPRCVGKEATKVIRASETRHPRRDKP